jgi:hypothetical protein
MCEELVYSYIAAAGFDVSPPDYDVYEIDKKNFDKDLYVINGEERIGVTVKGQDYESSARRWGHSWIFQKKVGGTSTSDPVIEGGRSLAMFVSIHLEERNCVIHGPFWMRDVRPHFKKPKLKFLKSKVAVYLDDIQHLPCADI